MFRSDPTELLLRRPNQGRSPVVQGSVGGRFRRLTIVTPTGGGGHDAQALRSRRNGSVGFAVDRQSVQPGTGLTRAW